MNSEKNNIFYILNISIQSKRKFCIGILFSMFSAMISLLIPIIVGKVLEILTETKQDIQIQNILIGIVIFILIYVLQGMSSYILGKMGIDAMQNLQCFFEKYMLHLKIEQSNIYAPGDMASRATNDISEVSSVVTVTIPTIVKNALIVIATTIILWWINSKLTVFIIIMLILLLAISHPVNNKLQNLYKVHQSILGEISAQITRCISNMVMIKAFVSEENEFRNAKILFGTFKNNLVKILKNETIWHVFLSCALMCDMVFVLALAKTSFANEIAGINILSAYILYMVQLLSPAIDLVNAITQLIESNGAFQRITEVLNLPQESNVNLSDVNFTKGHIKFTCVNFEYNDTANGLKNITMEIPEKSMVAIVGPSGAGKTTFFSLVLKLYENYIGKIEIDSNDIREISTNSIRTQIAYVSQNNLVINGTVMDNLRYGKNNYLDPEKIVGILSDNHMLSLFDDFSQGLYTDIGENGNNLSEGQKQRINIARAIISNPVIMLLDEITSNLDTKTEQEIMHLIEYQRRKSTVIIIAHRLNTVRSADSICVLNNRGEIECCGTHQYLLEHSQTYNQLTLNA